MQTRTGHEQSPSFAEKSSNRMAPLQTTASNEVFERSHGWSEGRKRFLHQQQEKYLQRLTHLREVLTTEKDLVRLNLQESQDKSTGFWEIIMTDFKDAPSNHNYPGKKTQRSYQSSAGGKLNSDLNRRGHLERLRRIRIMQMRRNQPPQLEPLHGIGIASRRRTENTPAIDIRPMMGMQTTRYHVNWLRGNHLVTPMVDHDKDIAAWTLKQMKLFHAENANGMAVSAFPNDFKTALHTSKPFVQPHINSEKQSQERNKSNLNHVNNSTHSRKSKEESVASVSTRFRCRTNIRSSTQSNRSSPPFRVESIPNPNHDSEKNSRNMQEIVSHNSSTSSRIEGSQFTEADDTEDNTVRSISEETSHPTMVDRACSPVGFRLPPLKPDSRASVSSSANSKKHIIVKIPDGIE